MLPLTYILAQASAPMAAGAEEDIRGPRPAVEIPVMESSPWLMWLCVAAAIASVVLLWRWLRRRRATPGQTAAARALDELDAVYGVRNELDAAPLADRAADVVRRFIAGKFRIAAPQQTTEEFLQSLTTGNTALSGHRESLQTFLTSCDAAKFAGASFNAAERLALVDSASRFIRAAAHEDPNVPKPDTRS